jgi:hypothetical protein
MSWEYNIQLMNEPFATPPNMKTYLIVKNKQNKPKTKTLK